MDRFDCWMDEHHDKETGFSDRLIGNCGWRVKDDDDEEEDTHEAAIEGVKNNNVDESRITNGLTKCKVFAILPLGFNVSCISNILVSCR